MEASEYRKPFIKFEVRAEEDRTASLMAGAYVHKDVDYIILVPHGSEGKLSVERPYSEWLGEIQGLTGEVRASGAGADTPLMGGSRFPEEWLRQIKAGYTAWKEGLDMPVEGTPLRNWPAISPAQLKNCLAIHLLSVEELANAADEAVLRLGMGGRSLQQRAKDWLKLNGGETGKVAAEMEKLRSENSQLLKRLEALESLAKGPKQVVEQVK